MTYSFAVTATSDAMDLTDVFATGLGVCILTVFAYVGGRVHQWFRQGQERDLAYRDGYNEATKSLFSLATRTSKAVDAKPSPTRRPLPLAEPKTMRGTASVEPRHRAKGKSTLQETKQFTVWERVKNVA